MVVGACWLALGVAPLLWSAPARAWMLALGALAIALGLVLPRSLRAPKRAWFAAGRIIGSIANPIVLGALFFVVFTPFALAARLLGKRPLALRPPKTATYWRARTASATATLKQQF